MDGSGGRRSQRPVFADLHVLLPLDGSEPYEAASIPALGYQHRYEPFPDARQQVADLPEAVCRILARGAEKDPANRYQMVAELVAAMDDVLAMSAKELSYEEILGGAAKRNTTAGTKQAAKTPRGMKLARRPWFVQVMARSRAAIPPRFRRPAWLAIGAGGLGAVLLLLGIVFYVTTDHGTIKIELSDPKAPVEVKIDGQTVKVAGLKEPLELKAGEHGLLVTSGEFETATQSFVVRRGTEDVVRVSLQPKGKSPSPKDLAKAAEPVTVSPSVHHYGEGAPPLAIAPFDHKKAQDHQQAWAKHLGVPVEVTNSIGMKLALIPPGEFMMGSPKEFVEDESRRRAASDGWYVGVLPTEIPSHQVRITKPFYLGATDVTQKEYGRIMGSNPSGFHGEPTLPVEQVNWDEAVEFCRKLSELPDEKAAKRRYQLPTEAQWEYACRAGNQGPYCFSRQTDTLLSPEAMKLLGEYAWYGANADNSTHPVAQERAKRLGSIRHVWQRLAVVSGLAREDYYAKSPLSDPAGPAADSHRVNRGGTWGDQAWRCRSAYRHLDWPQARGSHVGFRVCHVLVDSGDARQ